MHCSEKKRGTTVKFGGAAVSQRTVALSANEPTKPTGIEGLAQLRATS